MKAVKINLPESGRKELIISEVIEAASFLSKLSGLIIRKKLRDNQGFLIRDCNSIHTIGMRYGIDAVFLGRNNRVLKIYHDIKPFRVTPFIKGGFSVLETAAGVIKRTSLKESDLINFET
jgi:uncharacterized protein